ncbi:MAG: Lytic transglycosylase catalytic [Rhodocyclaceae bacterium]|nr:MAG: Lytic transglycosylase catalytic [Rhodocyclaceae bacterium]
MRYQMPSALLKAISRVESGGNPNALNRNRDGSFDVGHMQINSRWLPKLSHFGISRERLWEPCTNTFVGAWILAQNVHRIGYSWSAIGAYNATSTEKRDRYARKVSEAMKRESAL